MFQIFNPASSTLFFKVTNVSSVALSPPVGMLTYSTPNCFVNWRSSGVGSVGSWRETLIPGGSGSSLLTVFAANVLQPGSDAIAAALHATKVLRLNARLSDIDCPLHL